MKKQLYVPVIVMVLVVVISILSTGCAAPGLTRQDVHRRHVDMFHNSALQFQDDVDAVLLIDRPGRLSPMYVR